MSVQDLDSLSGKLLRIDPITGAGLPDNPFVEPGVALTSNQAKVWQMGLRNPFSMGFDDDGRLFITDTGWHTYEEINQGGAGANFGWPFYEGGDFGNLLQTAEYRDLPQAAAFYQAVANGDITISAAYRAFAHANAAPGFQFQTIIGGDAFPESTSYPAELRGDYFVLDFTHAELFAVDVNDRRAVKFLYKQTDGSLPVYLTEGPDGRAWYADIATGEIGRLQIEGRPVFNDLGPAQTTYTGTFRPEIYLVDAANDSTSAALDRITNFNAAGGDRVNFTATDWDSGDITFRRFNVGQPSEFTRLDGPNGFSLRIDEPRPDLAGALVFATPGNQAPRAANDTAATTTVRPVTVNVLANDSDPDGDALTIGGFAGPDRQHGHGRAGRQRARLQGGVGIRRHRHFQLRGVRRRCDRFRQGHGDGDGPAAQYREPRAGPGELSRNLQRRHL